MGKGDQMKYQEIIMGQRPSESEYHFRRFAVPVAMQDGRWLPAGTMREETHRFSKGILMLAAAEYESARSDCGPLSDIQAPDGWEVIARLWLPDDYVPQSDEVTQHARKEAVKKMLDLGITTPEQARRLLEDNDA